MNKNLESKIAELEVELKAVSKTLATLIAWLPQSANAPIRTDEAEILLKWIK